MIKITPWTVSSNGICFVLRGGDESSVEKNMLVARLLLIPEPCGRTFGGH